ncbi:metal-dependent hydrolase [Sporosarcina sp. 179-K 8C2 HS]|uniref:metal-dependent hydrolase n=1 Tax=Sporosarcina sp. 179-K 8C2 HS TaxID=3142387 RepID=UPI0039A16A8D
MEWSTHAISGMVAGYTVTGGDWKGAAVGAVAGVIPDLDEPKSKFGKLFFFVSLPIHSLFGHRTFTHSLLFAFVVGILVYPFAEWWVTYACIGGILAHITGDMLTGKVKLFYPSSKYVGISIPSLSFTLIDRIARLSLIIYVCWVIVAKLNMKF